MFRLTCMSLLFCTFLSCGEKDKVLPSNKDQLQEQLNKANEINKKVAEKMKQVVGEVLPSSIYEKYKAKPILRINLIEPVKSRVYGKRSAKNKIIVFSDFACSHCKTASKELKARINENKDLVNLTYVFYPLDKACNPNARGKLSGYSCIGVKLALCAEKQGKVWQAIDFLYDDQQTGNVAPFDARSFIKKIEKELNLVGLNECLSSKWLEQRLKKEHEVYKGMDIPGTPYVILNNRQLSNVFKFEDSFNEFMKYFNSKENSKGK